jgi:hypothetical protein
MGQLRCVDGSILTVTAVECRDRLGSPYEITLDLRPGRKPFASVGERCGFRLAQLAARVAAAREDPSQAAPWPDPHDRFPEPGQPAGGEFRPREREYFSLRSRDRGDLPGSGELRCVLRDSAEWLGRRGRGGWSLTRRAVIEAWGTDGIGVRAVLTSAELVTFLDTVLREPAGPAVAGWAPAGRGGGGGSRQAPSIGRPARRERGRVRDESTRSRLPALRAQA